MAKCSTVLVLLGLMVMTAVQGSALPDSDFEVEGTTPDMDFLDEWAVETTPSMNETSRQETDNSPILRRKRSTNSFVYGNLNQQIRKNNTKSNYKQKDSEELDHGICQHTGHVCNKIWKPPRIGCPIQIASVFPKPGYLTVSSLTAANQFITLTVYRTTKRTYFYRASESHGFTDASEFTLLTNTGMGDYANEPQYDTPAHNIRTQRLVRRWGRLAARAGTLQDSARLVLKRWPPICEDNSAEYTQILKTPPTYVQIMLYRDAEPEFNGALLNVDVRSNGYEMLNFIKRGDGLYPEAECVPAAEYGHGRSNPSVLPSTLFQVSYLPCE